MELRDAREEGEEEYESESTLADEKNRALTAENLELRKRLDSITDQIRKMIDDMSKTVK